MQESQKKMPESIQRFYDYYVADQPKAVRESFTKIVTTQGGSPRVDLLSILSESRQAHPEDVKQQTLRLRDTALHCNS